MKKIRFLLIPLLLIILTSCSESPKEESPTILYTNVEIDSVIPFESESIDDNTLESGKTVVKQEGKEGKEVVVYEIETTDGVETNKKIIDRKIETNPTTKITLVGTKKAEPAKKIEPVKKEADPVKKSTDSSKTKTTTTKDTKPAATKRTETKKPTVTKKTETKKPTVTQKKESYKNCTELRKVYPKGVGKDHPAYESKHDRDKDGWACEK